MREAEAGAPIQAPLARIAGFWRRIFAAIVDTIVLGIVGLAIGYAFYDRLIALGPYGRIVGFPIALLYFGLLNGAVGGGATLGKRALGIRVVGRDGASVSAVRSLWRGAVYLIPFYLNGLDLSFLPLSQTQMIVAVALDVFFVFGVLGATVYLYIANIRTRQVMHDLAAGTFVVRYEGVRAPVKVRINRVHLVVISIWLLIVLAAVPLGLRYAGPVLKNWFNTTFDTNTDTLQKLQSAVNADPDVLSTSVTVNTTTFVADSIAARVLAAAPDNAGQQRLVIVVRYGFDIGIASGWQGFNYGYTPDEWRARIRNARPGIAA
jgi:uncharacterized RDD family membrane protein YckC